MRILVVEDLPTQLEKIRDDLGREFPGVAVPGLTSEEEFVTAMPDILADPPDAAVIDMRLPWSSKDPPSSVPSFYPRPGGMSQAGLRCCRQLAQSPEMFGVPIVLYTSFPETKIGGPLPEGVYYLQRSEGPELIRLLRSALAGGRDQYRRTGPVFIAYGHDSSALNEVKLFVRDCGIEMLILGDVSPVGKTWLDTLLHAQAEYAVILLTPDDKAKALVGDDAYRLQARQNVMFELGFMIARLGPEKVCALRKANVEVPTNYDGIRYIPMDDLGAWHVPLWRAMKGAGLDVAPLG